MPKLSPVKLIPDLAAEILPLEIHKVLTRRLIHDRIGCWIAVYAVRQPGRVRGIACHFLPC